MNQTERSDRVRRFVVLATTAAAVAGAFIGSGVLGGTPIQDAAGGAFAADATVLAPAGTAFLIWSVIYLGLALYAVWQAFPAQGAKPLHRTVGYGVAASALLNAVWIACVQAWRIAESFVIIVLLLGVLLVTYLRACRRAGRGTIAKSVLVDGTIGLYLGWVAIAAGADLAAWLTAIGMPGWAEAPAVPAIVTLIVATLIVAFATWHGARWAPALAAAWGLAWIAVGRWTDAPDAPAVAATAVVVATALLLLAAWRFRARVRAAEPSAGAVAAPAASDG